MRTIEIWVMFGMALYFWFTGEYAAWTGMLAVMYLRGIRDLLSTTSTEK